MVKKEIVIDYREKNSPIPIELEERGFSVKFESLNVADYIVKGIAIERKTISDFIKSMINKRLRRQLKEIKQYPKYLLIIEGIDETELYNDDSEDGVHSNAIRGYILSILLEKEVPIVFTKDYKDTIKFIELLAKRKKREPSIRANKKTRTKKEQLQYLMEGFPGIGPKTSKKLLNNFKTIQNIMNADLEDLKEVIGKKAETIKNLITSKYES